MFNKIKSIFFPLIFFVGSLSLFQSALAGDYCSPLFRCMDVKVYNTSTNHIWKPVNKGIIYNARFGSEPGNVLPGQDNVNTFYISPDNKSDRCGHVEFGDTYWDNGTCRTAAKNPKVFVTYELYMKDSGGNEYRTGRFATLYIEADHRTYNGGYGNCYDYDNGNPHIYTNTPSAKILIGADEFAKIRNSREGECGNGGRVQRVQLREFNLS